MVVHPAMSRSYPPTLRPRGTTDMDNSTVQYNVLNPNTSLAFLPPEEAVQLEGYRYMTIVTLGAYAWNIFINADTHYKLLFRCRISLSTIAYFISIISTAVFIVGCVVFHVGSVRDCQRILQLLGIGYVVAVPTTAILFLLRITAVFSGNRTIISSFIIAWAAVVGCVISFPFSVTGQHIGPTRNCNISSVKPFSSAGMITSTIFDSLVFFAISWRLAYAPDTKHGPLFQESPRKFYRGRALPTSSLSRSLLRSGQVYYLVTVFFNIAGTVLLLSPSVPPLIHAILMVPNAALTNAMACKVFRDVRFGNNMDTARSKWNLPSFTPSASSPSNAPGIKVEKETLQSSDYATVVEVDLQLETMGSHSSSAYTSRVQDQEV